ncbi:MerR family transcriptional regulator, partial [Rhizobiaceae sp. 2RAB30]
RALGEDADTLRQWRTRKLCLLGSRSERGYWQYTFQDVCRMAVAVALYRFGQNLEIAMTKVADDRRVADAIDRIVVGLGNGDELLSFAAGVSHAGHWSSTIITNTEIGEAGDALSVQQWAAHDGIRGGEEFLAEQIWQINVTRIVARVGRLLENLTDSKK